MINVIAHDVQQVGNSLTLDCIITELVSNNNTLEIVWTDNSGTLKRTNVTSTGIEGLLPVYTDSYTIILLTSADQGREIQCIANRRDPPVTDSGVIVLNITGKLKKKDLYIRKSYILLEVAILFLMNHNDEVDLSPV